MILQIIFSNITLSASARVIDAYVKFEQPINNDNISLNEAKKLKHSFVHKVVPNNIFKPYKFISDIKLISATDSNIINNNVQSQTLLKELDTIIYHLSLSPCIVTLLCIYIPSAMIFIFINIILSQSKLASCYPPPLIKSKPLNRGDKIFLYFSGILCLSLCAFQFYLGFPGYHIIGDTYASIGLNMDNSYPVWISVVMELLYFYFGKHLYYLFLFNIIPFYAGIFFLIAGFYIRFRTKLAILLIFPIFIGNIYFNNFIEYSSFSLPMLLFCGYSMILFAILTKSNSKILWISIGIVLFFAILWRHNAIFSVYPAFIIICYLYLKGAKQFIFKYIFMLFFSAMLSLGIVVFIPKMWQSKPTYVSNHIFLHQIAGACVPSNDSLCFKDEWYERSKGFSDVVALYQKYPLNADPFNVPWGYDDERPFKHKKLAGLKEVWINAILKHPMDFLKHELRFIRAMWIQMPDDKPTDIADKRNWILSPKDLQGKTYEPIYVKLIMLFPENERSITLSPFREQIYSFLYEHRILFNHIYGVAIGGILMLVSLILLCFRRWRSDILVFCFSTSFASFASAFFIAVFSPVPETRYMAVVLPLSIIALINLIAFICERRRKRKISKNTRI